MIGVLVVLSGSAFVVLGYVLGAVRNIRRPTANHMRMARLLQRLIDQDNNFPTLPKGDREEAEDLIDNFYKLPTTKEIR